jgi:hypothetical protein
MIDCILLFITVAIICVAIYIIYYNIFGIDKYYKDYNIVYGIIATLIGIVVTFIITKIIKNWTKHSLLFRIIIETLMILIIKNIVLSFINLNNLFNLKWIFHLIIIVIIQIFYISLIYPVILDFIKLEHKHKNGHIHNTICSGVNNIIMSIIITNIILFFE